ncbi:hypothetical protein ABZ614_43365 [Streptomyces sp. NPDC013178]|uniref:hypothetical protein n=1 Tax=unclassified Streptomyces TaxID=2593676 RepID=UPI0033F46619
MSARSWQPAAGFAALVLALSACAGSTDPEEGDSTHKPTDDVTITEFRMQATGDGRQARADYRIRNGGPDPVTYTVVISFLDDDGDAAATRVVDQRVDNQATYEGTLTVPWKQGPASSGARVTDVRIR